MSRLLKLKRSEKGQALVEFALILPILLGLILGMIEFGWILNGKLTLTNAAREGARAAVASEDAIIAAKDAVVKACQASGLTSIGATINIDETAKSATVKASAKMKPIVGLFFDKDVSLTAQAVMRLE